MWLRLWTSGGVGRAAVFGTIALSSVQSSGSVWRSGGDLKNGRRVKSTRVMPEDEWALEDEGRCECFQGRGDQAFRIAEGLQGQWSQQDQTQLHSIPTLSVFVLRLLQCLYIGEPRILEVEAMWLKDWCVKGRNWGRTKTQFCIQSCTKHSLKSQICHCKLCPCNFATS
jgi:hypothetical protein